MGERKRIVFFTYRGTIGARCLQWLLDEGLAEVLAVVTWPDYVHPEIKIAVKEVVYDAHLPLYQPRDVNDARFISVLERLQPDLFVSMYFGKIFRPQLLSVPRLGCVNLHNSLLPRYRGQAPSIWAVANGDSEAGQTLHYLDEGVDSGDIIAQKAIPILPEDTGYSLGLKLEDLGVELFKEVFPEVLAGTAPRIPQDHSKATYCRAPRSQDARIDWAKSAEAVCNFVRAFTRPLMGAFSSFAGRTVRIWQVSAVDGCPAAAVTVQPGQVIAVGAHGPIVACGTRAVTLLDFEVEGLDRDSAYLLLAGGPSVKFLA